MLYDQAQLEKITEILGDQLEATRPHGLVVAKQILKALVDRPAGHTCTLCGSALPEFAGIIMDDMRGEIRFKGSFIRNLTGQELALFRILLDAKGRCLKQETLLSRMYQLKAFSDKELPDIKIIDVFICKLRKKLAPLGIVVKTAWGRGYYLEEPSDAA